MGDTVARDADANFAGFVRTTVAGVPVLWRRDPGSRTFRTTMLWQQPMGSDQAARGLLPHLLSHGTTLHPGRPALARAREMLYGAGGGFGIGRHGETSVMTLSADGVGGQFLPGRPAQFAAVIGHVKEQLLSSRLVGDGTAELFVRERDQALAAARAVLDDKGRYARQCAVANACAGEPYAVPDHGGEAAIAALDPAAPAAAFAGFLQRGRRVVLLSGALPEDPIAEITPLLAALPKAVATAMPAPIQPPRRAARTVVATAAMQQCRLVLVHRMPVPRTASELAAVQVALSLFGGGAHSRLFTEVRERRSLCYYASAGGDADKGLCLVQVGCDRGGVEAVVEQVGVQLLAIARGEFSSGELATAIAATQGPYRAIDDAPGSRLAYTADQWLRGFDQEPQQRIDALAAVTPAAVAAAAASIWLDCDFRLLPEGSP